AKRRSRLVLEHRRRQGDPSQGGSSRTPILTAYRQRALACATAMAAGPVSTKALRSIAPDAATLMLRNVYGWFERESRGIYRLTETGMAALRMALASMIAKKRRFPCQDAAQACTRRRAPSRSQLDPRAQLDHAWWRDQEVVRRPHRVAGHEGEEALLPVRQIRVH
ncbi:MAG: hypothetical protein EON47_19220, partial [Acetobacteraceae bacterium]